VKVSASKPGVVISATVHATALVMTLVSFSSTKPFQDAQEAVPVEIVTDAQINEVMRGEKDAKEVLQTPTRADKQAEEEERRPKPTNEAKRDVAPPPNSAKRQPEPGEADEREPVPAPPQKVAAAQPEPAKPLPKPPEPPKVEPKPEPPKPNAEAIDPPKPPQKPKEEPKKVEVMPPPPTKVVRPQPKEEPKPPKVEQLDRKALANLLDKMPDQKTGAKPKSGEEMPKTKFDSNAVSSLLSREAPSQRASTSRTPGQQASLGAPNASAAKMSPSLQGQLDGLMQEQYRQCWSYIGLNTARYIPQIKVEFAQDGSLTAQPVLLNPPGDPNLTTLSESALRAVRRCNPLKIPAQFAPYYDQWKSRILRFDPEEMNG
jgi:colicin import membrane protein